MNTVEEIPFPENPVESLTSGVEKFVSIFNQMQKTIKKLIKTDEIHKKKIEDLEQQVDYHKRWIAQMADDNYSLTKEDRQKLGCVLPTAHELYGKQK